MACALNLRSQIPRPLFLTRSSTTSMNNDDSLLSSKITTTTQIEENHFESSKSSRSCLVRGKSAFILSFRQRKAFSQMDFQHARRQANFTLPSPPPDIQLVGNCENKSLQISNCSGIMAIAYPKDSFVHKVYNQDHYSALHGQDPQMAGMKIFATIILNAWRQRRNEVKRLMVEIADLKRAVRTI